MGITIDSSGYVHVTEYYADKVAKFYPVAGSPTKTHYGSSGVLPGQFNGPAGIAFDKVSSTVSVAELENDRVQKFSDASYSSTVGIIGGILPGSGNNQFNNPRDIAIDKVGNIYVTDDLNHRIQKFSPSLRLAGQLANAGDVPIDRDRL